MHCPNCQSDRLVAIRIRPKATEDVTVMFRSCRACEHKWWEREDSAERVSLATVLEMAKVRRPA